MRTEEFISKATAKHGDLYDYSRVEYSGCKGRVEILCTAHGSFWQIASNHLSGQGCPKCGRARTLASWKSNTSKFVQKAKAIHGDTYGYHNVEYSSARCPVEILCPQHGAFKQSPDSHLHGHGCSKCADEKQVGFNRVEDHDSLPDISAMTYHIRFESSDGVVFEKIGVTTKTIKHRFSHTLNRGYTAKVLRTCTGTLKECVLLEKITMTSLVESKRAHKVRSFRDSGVPGWTECFYPMAVGD